MLGSKILPEVPKEVKVWFPIPDDGGVNFNARIKPEKIVMPERITDCLCDYIIECLEKIGRCPKIQTDSIIKLGKDGLSQTKKPSLRRHFCCACLQLRKSLAERGFRPQAHINNSKLYNILS